MATGDSPSPRCGAPPWGWEQARPGHQPASGGGLGGTHGRDRAAGWPGASGPKQEPLLEAAPPIKVCPHSAWEPPPKVTVGKGPPLAAVALSWPPVSPAQASWPPPDALKPLQHSSSSGFPKQAPHKGCIVTLSRLENNRQEMTAICSHQFGWAQFSRHCWLCGHVTASKWTMPAALCWIYCLRENLSECFSDYISWLFFFLLTVEHYHFYENKKSNLAQTQKCKELHRNSKLSGHMPKLYYLSAGTIMYKWDLKNA